MYIKNILVLVSVSFVSLGLILINGEKTYNYILDINHKKDIQNYIDHKTSDYVSVIEIPKLNLKVGIGSDLNKGLIYYRDNIIAGHSGKCSVCYFNDIDLLEIGDIVYIYNQKKTSYIVNDKWILDKDKVKVDDNMYLITCLKENDNKRLLIQLKKDID